MTTKPAKINNIIKNTHIQNYTLISPLLNSVANAPPVAIRNALNKLNAVLNVFNDSLISSILIYTSG